MTVYRADAPAKVNLSLHVGAVQDNGRHPLISLLAFGDARVADRLTARPARMSSLAVSGPYAEACGAARDNLVLKAARAMAEALQGDCPHLAFELEKRLPAAAGIGGGSADAAAALRLICEASKLPEAYPAALRIAPTLGGDVLACLHNQAGWMRGDGDMFEPSPDIPSLPALLVNPGLSCPTGPVFEAYDSGRVERLSHPPLHRRHRSAKGMIRFLKRRTRNDLMTPAMALVPEIKTVLKTLTKLPGARLARMSGSGATCFALFDTERAAEQAAELYARAAPTHWCVACTLGSPAAPKRPASSA